VPDYTHRDRRAHRDVGRAFWTVVGVSVGLTGLAMVIPVTIVGILAVLGLAVLGSVYLGWSDRMIAGYARDLHGALEGTMTDGFVRAETVTVVGLDRGSDSPRSLSPHSRRLSRAAPTDSRDPEASASGGSESDQA